jgi:hypothetical protein
MTSLQPAIRFVPDLIAVRTLQKETFMRAVRRIVFVAVVIPFFAASLTACDSGTSSVNRDAEQTDAQLERYQANQPVPLFDWSQIRETVTMVETAQATGIATSSFFFNQGSMEPVMSCPSIGYPVPATTQLTSPDQPLYSDHHDDLVVSQMEPTGVYSGETTATYVLCVNSNGLQYPVYWEGFVMSVGGPAAWDAGSARVVAMGDPTVVVDADQS